MFLAIFVYLFGHIFTEACIPTQNVESNIASPCNVCKKIYDTTCQGYELPTPASWCYTEADVGLTYQLGYDTGIPGFPTDLCVTTVGCPSGTTDIYIPSDPSNPPNEGYPGPDMIICYESGPNQGKWVTGVDGYLNNLASVRCQS